jgi:hypothetical protein
MNTIDECVFDKESFLAFMDEVIPKDHYVHMSRPLESMDQYAIILTKEIFFETSDHS